MVKFELFYDCQRFIVQFLEVTLGFLTDASRKRTLIGVRLVWNLTLDVTGMSGSTA